jgi:hypothetical protein
MICSTVGFLVAGGFVYLEMQGLSKAALYLLGANVLAFLLRFLNARL